MIAWRRRAIGCADAFRRASWILLLRFRELQRAKQDAVLPQTAYHIVIVESLNLWQCFHAGLRTVVEEPHFGCVQFVVRRDHLNPTPLDRFL